MRRLALIWLAGVALGLTAEWVGFGWGDPRRWIPDLAVGWRLIGCGLVASEQRPESRTGPLMAATGFTWFLGNFAQVDVAAVAWVAAHLVYLHRGPLVQLVLTYPSGRPSSRLARAALAVGYAAAVVAPVWRSEVATILLAALMLGVGARDYVRAVGRARRMRRAALQAVGGLSVVLAGTAAARLLLPAGQVSGPSLLIYEATLCALAVWLLAGLLLAPWDRAAVTDLVVELGEARAGTLRGQLSRALGDPSLEIGYWLPDRAVFVDAEGRMLFIPDPGSERSVTVVEREASRRRILAARDDQRKRLEHHLREGRGGDSASWRTRCAKADGPPPAREPGSRSPAPRPSWPERWRSCAGWRMGCTQARSPSAGWRAPWRCWRRTSRFPSRSRSQVTRCPRRWRWSPISSAPRH